MKNNFILHSKYKPAGDQPKAIDNIYNNIQDNKYQVLLGATGTGKTFTIANIIEKTQRKTLIMAHNKTLAGQLYLELKDFFPNNKVEYFVSYFDFYQPEAYLPGSDTYIEKTAQANNEISQMRLSTINSLSQYEDVIVIASVAAIYGSSSPEDFERYRCLIKVGDEKSLETIRKNLVKLDYEYNAIDLKPGTFRVKGDIIDIALGFTTDFIIKISIFNNKIEKIVKVDALTGNTIEKISIYAIPPAAEYIMNKEQNENSLNKIELEMIERVAFFNKENRLIEAQRIEQRTKRDIESMREFGVCNGIENYSRHLEDRESGSTPYTLFDYFNKNDNGWLLVMDESHMSIPQIRGMYNTDRSRKETLVDYGFRLPSALDNRPLNFDEFISKIDKAIFVSATPNDWEIEISNKNIVQQIVRPTGLVDPTIMIKKTKNQIDDLINEIKFQNSKKEKTFVTVMTIRMAEELTDYLKQRKIKVAYLHNKLKTLERSKILNDLRRDKYDVIVGINLLREGIDIPEVSLVAIFDADKPGLFRSSKSLIQSIGRAARNVNGRVIMYADTTSKDMTIAIDETNRRREIQIAYNIKNNIKPKNVIKDINDSWSYSINDDIDLKPTNIQKTIMQLKKQMLQAAAKQDYLLAAELRDRVIELSSINDSSKHR